MEENYISPHPERTSEEYEIMAEYMVVVMHDKILSTQSKLLYAYMWFTSEPNREWGDPDFGEEICYTTMDELVKAFVWTEEKINECIDQLVEEEYIDPPIQINGKMKIIFHVV